MKKKFVLLIILVLLIINGLKSQNIYEFDELNKIPYLDRNNWEIIAINIDNLYKNAIKTPEIFSTDSATEEVIYLYCDIKNEGKLKRFNPFKGVKYTDNNREDIIENNKLLFNLTFDERGYLIVPDKLLIISYREVEANRETKQIGKIAFELIIPDSIKLKLQTVRLKKAALVDKNSLNGDFTPVKVLAPIKLDFMFLKSKFIDVDIYKEKNIINFIVYVNDKSLEPQIIDAIKKQTELMQLKKGQFQCKVEIKEYYCGIDFNIVNQNSMFTNTNPTGVGFTYPSFYIYSFTGEGKKIKK